MKTLYTYLATAMCFLTISTSLSAQVQINRQVQMIGSTNTDRVITGVGDASAATQAVNVQTLQKGSLIYVETVGGTPDLITATTSPSFVPQAGSTISFKVTSPNTGATGVTLNLNGSGTYPIYKNNNNAVITPNELKAGQVVTVVFDGADWEMVGSDNLGNHQAMQNITSNANDAYDIGNSTNGFKDTYLTGSLKLDNATFISNGGSTNTFLGETQNITSSFGDNVLIGYQTGKSNTTGYGVLFAGYQAGFNNLSGSYGIFIGYQSGYNNTDGYANIFQGYQAGYENTIGGYNSFLGIYSGNRNTTGNHNIAIGYSAGYANISGNDNISIGNQAGVNNTSSGNIFIGSLAGNINTSGGANVSIGYYAGYSNFNGSWNTNLGNYAGYTASGNHNTCIGASSGISLNSGSGNTIMGSMASYYLSSGDDNTIIGNYAGFSLGYITHSRSTIMGRSSFAASGSTGAVALGYGASATTNSAAIGYNTQANTVNTMAFGNSSVTCWVFGRTSSVAGTAICVGTNASNGNGAYLTQGGVWTNTSDKNKKENFKSLNGKDIISKINQLKITRWNYIGEDPSIQHIGPMAQDFYRLFQLGNDDKSISTIDPAGVALIAIQELDKKDKELENKIAEIEKLRQEVEELKELIKSIKK